MSGDDIPYQLRPNKFIDRQMFLELLSRLVAGRSPENYVYISMGGRHLVDHHAIYGKLGIRVLFSFDMNANEVARQNFNRPTGDTVCVEMHSANLPSEIDTIFQRFPEQAKCHRLARLYERREAGSISGNYRNLSQTETW